MKKIIVIIFTFLFYPISVFATTDLCPEVSNTSINGVWEAIYTQDSVKVYRLELSESGLSFLSDGNDSGISVAWKLESRKVEAGRIELHFRKNMQKINSIIDDKNKFTGKALIVGTGRICESKDGNHGGLDVNLIFEPKTPRQTIYKLQFIQFSDETLTDIVKKMGESAAKTIIRTKKDNKANSADAKSGAAD